MLKIIIPFFLAVILIGSCYEEYKVGNLKELGYPIETQLRTSIIRNYMDTLILKKGYDIPDKWVGYNKLVDIDSLNNRRIYFKNNPEEMYLISFGGMLVLSDVFNPQIKQSNWIAEISDMPQNQELRIKKRFQNEILDSIESMAKNDGIPDSLIYK